jgi:hypothetical protein
MPRCRDLSEAFRRMLSDTPLTSDKAITQFARTDILPGANAFDAEKRGALGSVLPLASCPDVELVL